MPDVSGSQTRFPQHHAGSSFIYIQSIRQVVFAAAQQDGPSLPHSLAYQPIAQLGRRQRRCFFRGLVQLEVRRVMVHDVLDSLLGYLSSILCHRVTLDPKRICSRCKNDNDHRTALSAFLVHALELAQPQRD